MRPALLLTALLLASLAPAEPVAPPEKSVAAVLRRMRATLRSAPDTPAPRGPHEWTGRRALAAGTVNGCVEAAKAFQALYHDAVPDGRALLVDSFDPIADGGHAVVEVKGSDGVPFLVDAASFERLPGPPRLPLTGVKAPPPRTSLR